MTKAEYITWAKWILTPGSLGIDALAEDVSDHDSKVAKFLYDMCDTHNEMKDYLKTKIEK